MESLYLWVKALHIISFTAWMAGMFYLPRLYVYHADAPKGGELSETLKVMERKLLRIIMNPAMIFTWGFGIWLVILTGYGGPDTGGWMHAKFALVLAMSGLHGYLAATRKKFAADVNRKTAKHFRIINEIPTVLLLGIVLLVVLKPF